MRAIVTRPAAQAMAWLQGLHDAGIDAQVLPLIHIAPPSDPQAVVQAWAALTDKALVFFVSPNAVRHFFALAPAGSHWPTDTVAAAPGPGTHAALLAQGVPAAQIVVPPEDAETFDSTALWTVLQRRSWHYAQALIVRGEGGRDWLAEQLRDAGATTHFVAAYRRQAPTLNAAALALLAAVQDRPAEHLWLFSSSEAIEHLRQVAPSVAVSSANALGTHPRIADSARRAGFGHVVCCAPMMTAVVQAIRGWSIQSTPP